MTAMAQILDTLGYTNTPSSTWSQLGSDIDGEAANDKSGFSVALSDDGTIVSIGTPYNGGNGSNSGHVRVYAIQL